MSPDTLPRPEAQPANPFVGPRTFTYADRGRFFGREREARNLLARVVSERLMLFYAQSGAGKSSLLYTRLIPQLHEEEGFLTLPVARVSGELPAGVAGVQNIYVFNLLASIDRSDAPPERLASLSLSEFLAHLVAEPGGADGEITWRYDPAAAPMVHVPGAAVQRYALIVDQFEEIITSHPEHWRERADFFQQLNQAMHDEPGLWVVLTLREDYLAALDPYAQYLAERLRARFYMERMGKDAALDAIREPARLGGRPFAPGVAEKLVDDLRQVHVPGQEATVAGQHVEPVQLQVVCYQLWERLQEAEDGGRGAEGRLITEMDLAEAGDVNLALEQFYVDTLAVVLADERVIAAGVSERALRTWFDKELITETGIRNAVLHNDSGGRTGSLPNAAVDALAQRFLLRTELRGGGAWVELVHDRFVEPIRANNAAWWPQHLSTLQRQADLWRSQGRPDGLRLRGNALLEAERWAAAHGDEMEPHEREFLAACQAAKALAERERQQGQRIRVLAAVAGIVAIVAIIAAFLAVTGQQQARSAEATAVAEATRALNAEATAVAEKQRAEENAAEAEQQRELAGARLRQADLAVTAIRPSMLNSNPGLALLLAIEAAEVSHEPYAGLPAYLEEVLHAVLRPKGKLIKIKAVKAHNSHVWSLALRPDGTQFATVGCDKRLSNGLCRAGQARLWDMEGNLLAEFASRPTDISEVSYSPDGARLLTADAEGVVQLWDAGGRELATLRGYTGTLQSVAFSPDGQRILALGEAEPALLWDAKGQTIAVLDEKAVQTRSALFSTQGDRIVTTHCRSANEDGLCTAGYASLWDANGRLLTTFAEGAGVKWAAFDPSGSRIATAECASLVESRCVGGIVRVWDAMGQLLGTLGLGNNYFRNPVTFVEFDATGTRILANSATEVALWKGNGDFVRQLDLADATLWRVRFSSDGLLIITTSTQSGPRVVNPSATNVSLWDANGYYVVTLPGHEGVVQATTFTPDHGRLLTAGLDGLVQIWDTRDTVGGLARQLAGHKGFLYTAEYSPTGDRLVTVAEDGVRLWDRDAALLAHLEPRAAQVYAARFNREGTLFVTVTCDVQSPTYDCSKGALRLWDADGHPVREVAGYRIPGGYDFAPQGGRMVVAGEGSTALLLDASGATLAVLTGHSGPINRIAYSEDGTRLGTASDDSTVRIWDADGSPLLTLSGHTGPVRGLGFSESGTHIFTYGDDGSVRLWDNDGNLLQVLSGHPGGVKSATFNRAGTLILAESHEGPVRLWDLDGQLVAVIGENTQSVDRAVFDPSGERILTVECNEVSSSQWCIRHSVNLWDTQGKRLYTVDDHWVEWAAFRPDGAQIVTAGCDTFDTVTGALCERGGVWLWRVHPDIEAMIAEAKARAGRTLTAAECQQYLGQEQCP